MCETFISAVTRNAAISIAHRRMFSFSRYDSKADVVTAAVRKPLTDYNYYRVPRRREEKVKLQ